MAKMTPINDHFILKLIPREEKTKSGIIIPEKDNQECRLFEVIAIPNITDRNQACPAVGSTVVLERSFADTFTFDGQEYHIADIDLIVAIIN